MHRPFARALAFASALAEIATLPLFMREAATAQLGSYRSRGKGLGRRSGRKPGNASTLFENRADHFRAHQSKACARRLQQIQRGMLQAA